VVRDEVETLGQTEKLLGVILNSPMPAGSRGPRLYDQASPGCGNSLLELKADAGKGGVK